eukprot:gene6525-10533_t
MLKKLSCFKTNKVVKDVLQTKNYATLMHSESPDHAKRRVLAIYRILLKDLPWIKNTYQVTTTQRKMRDRVKREFLVHKNVKDLKIIDNLIFTAVEQVEDTKARHSQRGHVLRWFEEEDTATIDYLESFHRDSMNLPEDLDFGPKIGA